MSYRFDPTAELDQGDIIRQVVVFRKSPAIENESSEVVISHVLVLSHGCEIDKPVKPEMGTDTVIAARVISLDAVSKDMQGNIRTQRVVSAFYLPQEGPMPREAYVDWRTIQPVDKAVLLTARLTERYICTLDQDMFDAAAESFWSFFFRQRSRHNLKQ